MQHAYIVAAEMIPFGKYPDRSAADLGRQAIAGLMARTGLAPGDIEAVYAGRSFSGAIDGQVSIPGQVALRGTGIEDLPVFNFDNACAAVPSALHMAVQAVRAGQYEQVLVIGMDKLFALDRRTSMKALLGAMDMGEAGWMLESDAINGSIFMETYYGRIAREYLANTGATALDLAKVAVKNRAHASLNPVAQYRKPLTEDEVLASPMIASPLTKLMCSPLTDGAAALLVTSARIRKLRGGVAARVAASAIRSGKASGHGGPPVLARTAAQAYAEAGLGPQDLDLAEVHEASAVGELIAAEEIGLCRSGDGARLVREGESRLGGRIPVNVSGGLLSRGHPGAATGASQLVELVWQLQGNCGARQVENAQVGLAHSSGGLIDGEPAATAVTILTRDA